MKKHLALLFIGALVIVAALILPIVTNSIVPSSCSLGKVGAQDNPCVQQEATLSSLRFAATLDHIQAQSTIANLQTQVVRSKRTATPRPTTTPIPSPTLNPDAFDMSKAVLYTANADVFEMPLPPGWTDLSGESLNQFSFSFGDAQMSRAQLRVFVIERKDLAALLDLKVEVETTEEAITQYKSDLLPSNYPYIGEVTNSNIGKYDGFALAYTAPPNPAGGTMDATKIELRLADIPGTTKVIALVYFAEEGIWEPVSGVVAQMIDAMVFNIGNVPTATPTATIHPLEMTATYVQTLIIGLTPSPTKISPP